MTWIRENFALPHVSYTREVETRLPPFMSACHVRGRDFVRVSREYSPTEFVKTR